MPARSICATACEASLRRLRRERIDVYQLHSPDPKVPLEDSIGELVRLKSEGKIRHIGVSNVSLEELQRCERLTPIVSVQNRYNLEDRRSDEVLAYCESKAIAFLPWAPLGSGRHARGSGGRLRALAAVARAVHGITARPGGDRLAPRALDGDVADPGDRVDRASRAERRGRFRAPVAAGHARLRDCFQGN